MTGLDANDLIGMLIRWINEGHEAIMWLSGITGLSSAVILLILLGIGRSVVRLFLNLMKIVLVIAVVLFLLAWYIQSGHQLPSFQQLGIPTIAELHATGEEIVGQH